MRLEHLADVHAAGHAERVEDDVHRCAVLEMRHVFLGHDLRDDALVAVPAGELVALGDLAPPSHVGAHELVDARRQLVVVLTAEYLDVDHLAALAVRHLEARVADLASLLLEDGADELLLGGELGFALGSDLAHQEVARRDFGADTDDAALVEVLE